MVAYLDGKPIGCGAVKYHPDAPAEIRGEFKPIATKVPGIQIGEHLPRLAACIHRSAEPGHRARR